jgi:proprotein convertase subtilisin/kexin type 5
MATPCSTCLDTNKAFCTGCDYDSLQMLAGNNCVVPTCLANQNYIATEEGKCRACLTTGCTSCDIYGKCTSCSVPGYTDLHGVCCNTLINTYRDFTTSPPSCQNCHASCKTCHGPNFEDCLSCEASITLDPLTGTCCLSDEYRNAGVCTKCP